ncbi:MAG: hypothetical protein HZC40_03715 [Chloroflexi bacterium]|nr:hypothetical protein [Chloroflexota bacterium]
MKHSPGAILVCVVFVAFLLGAPTTHAQTHALAVFIQTPAQGETFYVAPSSFLYSIYVKGWIVTSNPEPTLIKVELALLRGTELTARVEARAQPDGSFSFSVTANPDAADFPDPHTGCIECHFTSALALPRGKVIVRVTAIDPAGNRASAERAIIVDHSGTAIIPIQVVDADQPARPIAHIPVLGSARLYLWRARTSIATTDAGGLARVQVEALGQASTRYVFDVPPVIVNGVWYESVESKQVTLKPGQTLGETLTLPVRARRGQITGALRGAGDPGLTVRAIDAITGASFVTHTRTNAFAFSDLPVARYFVALDPAELAPRALQAQTIPVDLTTAPAASITLTASVASSRVVRGALRDINGAPVSFGWIEIESRVARAHPATGEFVLYDVPAHAQTLRVIAPGFWSRNIAIQNDAPLAITLAPRDELRSIAWGRGAIAIPPETIAELIGGRLVLTHGVAWSNSPGTFAFETAGATITLANARVAIERQAERAWLYVIEGTATVALDSARQTTVNAGQMIVIDSDFEHLRAVAIDPHIIRVLTDTSSVPFDFVIEPTLSAQARDLFARFGISIAQGVTFATYLLITLALVGAPLLLWGIWLRATRQNHPTG